jgi:predicted RNase H-like nuclease
MSPGRGHGPSLPYQLVAGVVPCRRGWLVASAKLLGVTIAPEVPRWMESIIEVIDEKPAFSVIALAAPVGLLDRVTIGGRTCDRQARSLLGPRRGAAIRSAPSWLSFEGTAAERTTGLDAVSAVLLPRYDEVATEMAPYRQRLVYETDPELGFYQLNADRPMRCSKRYRAGRQERRDLLVVRVPGVDRILDATVPGARAAQLLDVAACLWTARRILARVANRIPADPEWDSHGLRMEYVW